MTHGTVHAYKNLRCRCDDCRKANTEYTRLFRARKRNAQTPTQQRHMLAKARGTASYWRRECEEAKALAEYWRLRAMAAERKASHAA